MAHKTSLAMVAGSYVGGGCRDILRFVDTRRGEDCREQTSGVKFEVGSPLWKHHHRHNKP